MHKDRHERGSYVRRVREETQQFASELMAENEKLRALVLTAEGEKVRAEEELLALKEDIARNQREHLRLEQRLADIETENKDFSARFFEVEQHNSNLANLYVVSYRLHGTLDRGEVLSVIQEIIINLIGSEELALFEMNSDETAVELVASFGIDPEQYRSIGVGSGLIGRVALEGKPYVADRRGADRLQQGGDVIACIPLKLGEKTTGVIAMFSLLPQKSGLEAIDYELFELLATHAAMALYCSGMQARLEEMEEVQRAF